MILDHAFVLPRRLDPAVDLRESTREAADVFSARLAEAGFIEGSSRSHPGQGTVNRRLFLSGVMIECLFVDDVSALDSPRGALLALGARFRDPASSGVGLAFRPGLDASGELPLPTFASSAYRPAYLPEPLRIDVASGFGPEVPLLFHLPFVRSGGVTTNDDEPRSHPNGAHGVAGMVLERAEPLPGNAEATLRGAGIEYDARASAECLHVKLQGLENNRLDLDMRPLYPLRLHS